MCFFDCSCLDLHKVSKYIVTTGNMASVCMPEIQKWLMKQVKHSNITWRAVHTASVGFTQAQRTLSTACIHILTLALSYTARTIKQPPVPTFLYIRKSTM